LNREHKLLSETGAGVDEAWFCGSDRCNRYLVARMPVDGANRWSNGDLSVGPILQRKQATLAVEGDRALVRDDTRVVNELVDRSLADGAS
jgi:hypothetical protein